MGIRDLATIRSHLVLFLCLSLLGLGLAQGSLVLVRAARLSRAQAVLQRQEMRRQLAAMNDEAQAIGRKLARYRELAHSGYLEREDRLSWVEQIGRIETRRGLFAVRYELAPQQPIASGDNGYELMSSRMNIDLQLLHEEDLLNFFADLRKATTSYPRVRSCRLDRLPVGDQRSPLTARLQAACSIDWISLREKK